MGEIHQWDLACNPGTWPDQESNQPPFSAQADAQSTEPHHPGHRTFLNVEERGKKVRVRERFENVLLLP